MKRKLIGLIFMLFLSVFSFSQQKEDQNYAENTVRPYTLPNPLVLQNGETVNNSKLWWNVRRKEILSLFENEVYGKTPSKKLPVSYRVNAIDKTAFGGKATRKQITISFTGNQKTCTMQMLLYIPNHIIKPVPVFFSMNFSGNQTISDDPEIFITNNWVKDDSELGFVKNKAFESSRGKAKKRWPIERILERGYAIATVYYGDLYPDFANGKANSILPLFDNKKKSSTQNNEWGAIGAWAWGYSRAMDYFETDKSLNHKKVAIMGHSRLGKAALWAGAQDKRFAIVISNNSGCGGAALSKRWFGETVWIINQSFPHWFCANFKKYNKKEDALPVDQHELLALIAPRPLYVASGENDLWADPNGEFLSVSNASPVYKLLGTDGLEPSAKPLVNEPITSTLGYHVRTGGHDVTLYDLECYMNFVDKYFKRF